MRRQCHPRRRPRQRGSVGAAITAGYIMRGLAGTTILQRRLGTILEDLGIPVIEEYSTGRYRLDFFAPDEWLGFEADGPCHGRQINKDRLRDKEIMDRMGIPILRLTPMDIGNPVIAKLRITEFMREHRLEPRREPASF